MPRRRRVSRPTGIGEIGKANRRKGQSPFSKTSEASNASFCLGASATKGGFTVAPFGISASRNSQSPPNCPTISGSGYVQTVALGKNCDGVRTEDWIKLTFCGDRSIGVANLRKGQSPFNGGGTAAFTRPAGVGKIGIANFSVGGKTPFIFINKKKEVRRTSFFFSSLLRQARICRGRVRIRDSSATNPESYPSNLRSRERGFPSTS